MAIPSLFALTSGQHLASLSSRLDPITVSRVSEARAEHSRCPQCSHEDGIKDCLLFADGCDLITLVPVAAVLYDGEGVERRTMCLACYRRWKNAGLCCYLEGTWDGCIGPLKIIDLSPPEPGVFAALDWACENHRADAVALVGEAYDVVEAFRFRLLGVRCWYDAGRGIEKNVQQAGVWYRRAAEQGHAGAQCELAECYYAGHSQGSGVPRRAVKRLRRAADQNHPKAQCSLWLCYSAWTRICPKLSHGCGRRPTKERPTLSACWGTMRDWPWSAAAAVSWYRKAAATGSPDALCLLGGCCLRGIGLPQDEKVAVQYYRDAAMLGHAGAQHELGMCYYEGRGLLRDLRQAVPWFKQAAE